jgi:hypothetical protein
MAVLMEYIVALIYIYIGFSISRIALVDSVSVPKPASIGARHQESREVKRDYESEEAAL